MEIPQVPLLLWLIFSLVSLFACFFVYIQLKFHVWKFPPGPLPVSLSFIQFLRSQEKHKMVSQFRKKYGPLFSIPSPSSDIVIVADFDTAKDLLNHPSAQGRPRPLLLLFPGEEGFGSTNGDVWQKQRRFCVRTMRSLGFGTGLCETISQQQAAEFVQHLQNDDGKPSDVSGPLSHLLITNNIIMLIGQRLSNEENNASMQIIHGVDDTRRKLFSLCNPIIAIPWLLKCVLKFNIFGYGEYKKLLEEYENIFRREVQKYRDSSDTTDSKGLIGPYFETVHKMKETADSSNYSEENLVGNLIHLFIGATDTVYSSIQWLIVLMAAYPNVQKKVHEELDDVIGRKESPCWNDRHRLPYTMATISEMERWAAVLQFYVPRSSTETFEFRGYIIPKDTVIFCANWEIHRDPKYWSNPDEYVPERFLQDAENSGKVPSICDGYAPFSFGKRSCPGGTVGLMTTFVFFTQLMQKFMIVTPPGQQVDLDPKPFDMIMEPKDQLLCFTER